MDNISFFLQKYSTLGLKEEKTKETLIKVIENTCGFIIDKKDINIQNQNINISIQGAKKAEIFIKKEKIWKEFKKALESKNYKVFDKDIR